MTRTARCRLDGISLRQSPSRARVDQPSSMLTVDDLGAARDLLARHFDRARCIRPRLISFLNLAEPVTLVRSAYIDGMSHACHCLKS